MTDEEAAVLIFADRLVDMFEARDREVLDLKQKIAEQRNLEQDLIAVVKSWRESIRKKLAKADE